MGTSQASSATGLATAASPPPASPVDLVEFTVEQVLRDDAGVSALPAILGALTALFGCRAALALQQGTGEELVALAAHPGQATADRALLGQISALLAAHGELAAEGGHFEASLTSRGRAVRLRLAYAAPAAGRFLCAVALVGGPARFNAGWRAATRSIAAIVAAQIRHANDTAELAERQARAMALFDGAPYAILAASADRRLVAFNQAAEELTGWQRDEVLGKELELLVPERARAAVIAGARTCLESGDRAELGGPMRLPVLRADGTERVVELTPVPLTIGGQLNFCGFLRDMSELQSAHVALLDSEGRFRLLSQLAPVGILQADLAGTCTYANDYWCELTGMTARQAVGMSWSAAVHPDDIEPLERQWAAAAVTGRELRTDCRLLPANGEVIWVHIAVVPISSADGRPLGFLTAVTNISDWKRAEAERERLFKAERNARRSLADQTERLNALITAAISGILVENEHGIITQVNQSFCDMFGIGGGPGQLVGTTAARTAIRIRRVFADPDEFLRRAGELLAGRRPVAEMEFVAADGRTIECDFAPVFVDGDYRGIMWGVADVTHRQQLKEERQRLLEAEAAAREASERAQANLAEQNVRLQQLDEAKTQFISTMSHELRTPLTSIISFTELVMDDEHELSQETVGSLSVIQRNAERLLRLVGDLLLLSRLENGAIPLDLATVSVPDLIAEAVRSASAVAADRSITVQVAGPKGPPVQGDPLRLRQVIDNLLSNAIKYTGKDGKIRVEATHDDQRWRVDVADDGIGIPPDELGHLFDRFVRASNARTAGLPGTGLGLSVVKAITELHGGSVQVRSIVGHGTTFSVYLPVRP
jgi:PAS domain S-box-containing protein